MKVAISSQGKTLEAPVDQQFGRAACFLLVDTGAMTFEVVENEPEEGGAGVSAAKTVIDAGAEVVLAGNCGPNAERALRVAGVKLFTGVSGTVAEAVEQYKAGKLVEASGPSVRSHHGAGA